jgi:hypothetical protein
MAKVKVNYHVVVPIQAALKCHSLQLILQLLECL